MKPEPVEETPAGGNKNQARYLALGIAVVGTLLILAGVVMILTSQPPAEPLRPSRSVEQTIGNARRVQYGLLLLLILVGIFVVGSFAFLRWSRSYRRRLLHRPAPPTTVEDVWTMHRLPEEEGEDEPEERQPKPEDES